MSERDVFNTQTWNFLNGDRAVESTLRELGPGTTLVVRNQVGNVLATVAGIRDLRHVGWGEGFDGPIWVPENALRSVRPELQASVSPDRFFLDMLSETFGVSVSGGYLDRADGVVLVLNTTEENRAGPYRDHQQVLTAIRQALQGTRARLIFVAPPGAHLTQSLRPLAADAWSTLHWEGRNAFVCGAVEEAVLEANPRHITVMGLDPEQVFYTAIGAVDCFISQDAGHRNPQALQLWDLLELGGRVSVPIACTAARCPADGGARPFKELIAEHLLHDLKVASTAASPRFHAGGESIALDILGL